VVGGVWWARFFSVDALLFLSYRVVPEKLDSASGHGWN
jgi:hypothetical protein